MSWSECKHWSSFCTLSQSSIALWSLWKASAVVSQGGSTTKEDSGIFCLPSGGKISRSPPQPSLGHPHTCIWTGHWHSWIIFINPSIFVCFGIVPVLTVRQRHVLDPACWKLLCSSLAPGFSKGKKSPLISRYRTVVLFFFFPNKDLSYLKRKQKKNKTQGFLWN